MFRAYFPTDVKTDDIVNTSRNANNTMDKAEKRPIPTLKECLLSTMYILEVAWIAILQLRFSYFLVSLNSWLTHRKTDGTWTLFGLHESCESV